MGNTARWILLCALAGWAHPAWAVQTEACACNFFLSALACAFALALCVQFSYLAMRRLLKARARREPPIAPPAP
ncbi:hypothetical protein DESUT3_39160 [Desulfuromonas versatilis]|uniref:Uncharacterized protein n=1 Tax=Desulfuromonas versatilis TaxID=2802975 RepID=A0ABN6E3Q7_9BACT|nr:hypothetical protein [Desulfuromonas versatilis]BCR06847.1 hypothetical protein DESUT3_39160 [Desulfuromonas versatilis]